MSFAVFMWRASGCSFAVFEDGENGPAFAAQRAGQHIGIRAVADIKADDAVGEIAPSCPDPGAEPDGHPVCC
jgi:hypothetical protein